MFDIMVVVVLYNEKIIFLCDISRFLLTLRVKIRVIWGNEYLFGDIPQLGQLLNELGGFVVYYTYPPYKLSNNQLVSNT